ncbi:MAG: SDR family oxidoreductase [Lachnospiraceae bacterium]|nr:SDR family oxidoreductase [Lachnospiraceae bacterium]MCI1425013.1 SDR family oxidoreductase [Lachnospiraceae bacterium]MCI1453690.1 SDR family oxidoreductase [Lachnospiraceae bacterium]MDD5849713.1 SDR family oxidoreductase [Bacillota bacterium]
MKNRLALVTGASRGIGAAIAEALAQDGYDLVLTCSKSMAELMALSKGLEERFFVAVKPVLCDVSDPNAVRLLFSKIHDLDVLVNNAGISYVGLLQDMTDADWDRSLATNLSGCFYTCREAIPLFLKKQDEEVPGRILSISSVWGNVGASCEAAYSASKGGVNALTMALAKELAPSRIPVNAIACGCVDTRMNGHLSVQEKQALAEEIPAGRFAKPSEIADSVRLLLRAPAYLTGQVLTVDGGWI